LLEQLRGMVGERSLAAVTPALQTLLEQFELVPRHELEGHLRALAALEAKVAELERRLAAIEQG
jgi:hypothetical protein